MNKPKFQKRSLFMLAYIVFALLPIYWMVNMSFKTNNEILAGFSLFPDHFTWDNYKTILTDPAWYSGYINSLIYVGDQHGHITDRGVARGLCVFSLQLSG